MSGFRLNLCSHLWSKSPFSWVNEGLWCCSHIALKRSEVPLAKTWTVKPGKMGRHFPVREKSGNFKQTGKVRENHTKNWNIDEISEKCSLLFLVIFK